MRTALLRGRECTRIGAISTIAEGRAALALSRGGAHKTYAYREPNEDACAFAVSQDAVLVAVADGHWGAQGAALALERLLEAHAPRWTTPQAVDLAERWRQDGPDVALDLNGALLEAGKEDDLPGRTTLTLCLARPEEDLLLALAVGDSHCFRVVEGSAREILPSDPKRMGFLGDRGLDRAKIAQCVRTHVERGARGGALALATDGLSERGIGVDDPPAAAAESVVTALASDPELRPLVAARALAEHALAAHRLHASGDNIATAVTWLERDSAR